MFLQRSKVLIASLIAAALIASCGGSDTTTRQRNVALEGKVQCLSDEGTTISATGLVQLDLCTQAKSFQILKDGSNVTEKIEVKPNSMNYFQAPAGKHVFHVVAYNSNNVQVGEDVLTTVTDACSTGGACALGDTGPGGGIVVYDAGAEKSWGRYIEIARKGWYDYTEGPTASEDPRGRMLCLTDWLGTTDQLGAGKNNTEMMIALCKTPNLSNIDSYSLVDLYNSNPLSAKKDWVLPTAADLLEIERSYKSISDLQLNDYFVTSSEANSQRWVYIYRFGRKNLLTCPAGCSSTTKSSAMPVRPIRYFTSDGPVTPTVKVVGIMDMPTTTEVSIATTTTEPAVSPNSYSAPTDVVITGDNDLSITWQSSGDTENQQFVVSYQKEGGEEVTFQNVPCCLKTFPFSTFEANVQYSFVVSRLDDKNQRVSAEPVLVMPNINLGMPNNGGTSMTIPPEEEPTTTSTEASESTTSTNVDCSVPPSVKFTASATSDEDVNFIIHHPCFGKYDNQQLQFGRATIDDLGNEVVSETRMVSIKGQSASVIARFQPGKHVYFVQSAFFVSSNESYISEYTRIEFNVAQGDAPANNSCDNDSISMQGTNLVVRCPHIWIHSAFDENRKLFPTKADATKMVADLSSLAPGWHEVQIRASYGFDMFSPFLNVCLTGCEIGSSFEPFDASIKDNILEISNICTGTLYANQMYMIDDHIFVRSVLNLKHFEGLLQLSLRDSTSAVLLKRRCNDDQSLSVSTFTSLERTATPPSEEDPSSSDGMKIAIISLPEITIGGSDVSAGEVSGGSVLISPQAELFSLPADVINDLMKLTIAGSSVTKAEVSVDGKTWLPADFGEFVLPAEAKSLQFRLTAEDGAQTVITREIDKSAPVIASENAPSASGSHVLLYVLILLGLLVLAAVILAVRKKRSL